MVESEALEKVFSRYSWSDRGWCRMERSLRELSMEQFWVLIKSSTEVELVANSSPIFIGQSAGEGHFTVAGDRAKLAPILQRSLLRKLRFVLETQDLVGYRVLLNMQTSHLRGFQTDSVHDLVPGFELEQGLEQNAACQSAQHFLYQNGFASVKEFDSGGWTPVHYAALRGDPLVLQGLLQQGANINRWTRKDQPRAAIPFGCTAVGICSYFKHHQALGLLLSARAKVDAGLLPDVAAAANGNNAEGIRLLCASGGQIFQQNLLGAEPKRPPKSRFFEAPLKVTSSESCDSPASVRSLRLVVLLRILNSDDIWARLLRGPCPEVLRIHVSHQIFGPPTKHPCRNHSKAKANPVVGHGPRETLQLQHHYKLPTEQVPIFRTFLR